VYVAVGRAGDARIHETFILIGQLLFESVEKESGIA
jgi:hypothetical protein